VEKGISMSEITSAFNLYDTDILRLEKVIEQLNRKIGTATNMEGFRQEILDRMARAGFRVDVKVYSTTQDGTYAFDIEIKDRLDSGFTFDYDQQVHEVTHDLFWVWVMVELSRLLKMTYDAMEQNIQRSHRKDGC
jgi:hypothetical protein